MKKNGSDFILLLIVMLFVETATMAQRIDSLYEKHVESLGGLDAVSRIKSLKIKQIATSNKMDMPITTIIVPGEIYYQTVKSNYGVSITSVTSDKGWIQNPFATPHYKELPENTIKTYLINSKYLGPLYDYAVNGDKSDVASICVEDSTNIDRELCYKLKVVYKTGYTIHAYLSKMNYMIKKVDTPIGITTYGNYKKVNGVMMPYYIETTNKQGVMTAVVLKIETNIKVDYGKIACP